MVSCTQGGAAALVAVLLAFLPAASADAATSGLPTASGLAACGRLGADRAQLRSALIIRSHNSGIRVRTARQRAVKVAKLRQDAARVAAASARLRADTAACDARWHWSYPNQPRLGQGQRPYCELFAELQQLNARGARISQAMANQVADEVAPQAPSADWGTNDMVRAALARRGVKVSYRVIAPKVDATLAELQHGPLTVTVTFTEAMYGTDRSGHWLVGGRALGLDHGVVLIGFDPRTQRVLLLNQWGREWGIDGAMWLTRAEYARLLSGGSVWTLG